MNRRRRLGELLGGELLGAASIASAVAQIGGDGGGGGAMTGGVHGDLFLGLSVVAEFTDDFGNGIIESPWAAWRGSFIESGGLLTTASYDSSTPRSAIMATHAQLADGECQAMVQGPKQNALWARCTRNASDGRPIGYMLLVQNTSWSIMRQAPGSTTIATALGTAPVAGDTIALRVVGSTITGKLNGTAMVSATDSTYTIGYWGVGQWTNSAGANSYSSWRVDPV